jgi:hypothetical protein
MDKGRHKGYCSLIGAKGSSSKKRKKKMTQTKKIEDVHILSIKVSVFDRPSIFVNDHMLQVAHDAIADYLRTQEISFEFVSASAQVGA